MSEKEKNENLTPEELTPEELDTVAGGTSSQTTDLKIRVKSNLSTTQQVLTYQDDL